MRHPLDHWTNSIGRTLGLVDVRCFFKELVATFSYKYPSLPMFYTPIQSSGMPLGY
jgi:hypothetical protein